MVEGAATVAAEVMVEAAVEAKATKAHGNTGKGLAARVIPGKEALDLTPTILQDSKECLPEAAAEEFMPVWGTKT